MSERAILAKILAKILAEIIAKIPAKTRTKRPIQARHEADEAGRQWSCEDRSMPLAFCASH
jgi:hypothetical protein